MKGAAIFSNNRHFRYVLMRRWADNPSFVNFVMLNPSTASATKNDPTIRRCIGFAKRLGHTGILVTNLMARRAPKPKQLRHWSDVVGPKNDAYIRQAQAKSDLVIVAWGARGSQYPHRVDKTLQLLGFPFFEVLYCLGRCKNTHPRHPLRLPHDQPLEVY